MRNWLHKDGVAFNIGERVVIKYDVGNGIEKDYGEVVGYEDNYNLILFKSYKDGKIIKMPRSIGIKIQSLEE